MSNIRHIYVQNIIDFLLWTYQHFHNNNNNNDSSTSCSIYNKLYNFTENQTHIKILYYHTSMFKFFVS